MRSVGFRCGYLFVVCEICGRMVGVDVVVTLTQTISPTIPRAHKYTISTYRKLRYSTPDIR